MYYSLTIGEADHRMYCRASGIWDEAVAGRFLADMIRVRAWAMRSTVAISVLSDLTGLSVHTKEVAPIVAEGARQLEGMRYDRYAMIVPSSLMRMQVRRIDPLQNRRFFNDVWSAAEWLGWTDFVPIDASHAKLQPA